MLLLRGLVSLGLLLALGVVGCNETSGTGDVSDEPEVSDEPWVPVGTYHLPGPIATSLIIEPDGTFRWALSNCDNGARGGGQWQASDGRLVLTPIDDGPTLRWVVDYAESSNLATGEFESLEVVPGAVEGELLVFGVGEEAFDGSSGESAYDIRQNWPPGGVCSVCDQCGERSEPCEEPPYLWCNPDYHPWCPRRPADPSVCTGDEDCDDGDLCTDDVCVVQEDLCVSTPVRCDDLNDCTAETACDSQEGCNAPVPMPDETPCAGGVCRTGACELRTSVLPCTEQGIRNAVAAGGGPYTFDCDGPTTVATQAEIVIEHDVTLHGEGNLTIDGNDDHRVLVVSEGATVEVDGLSVTGATSGILNLGTLTLTNSIVSGNGEGIRNLGALTMRGCAVLGNVSVSAGGIINLEPGVLSMTNCTVSGNRASHSDGGGGIVNLNATMTISSSTVSENTGRLGGGILNIGSALTIVNSTVSGNRSSRTGGGITSLAPLTLTNTTVSDNEVREGSGGGIWSESTLSLTNCTVSGNRALGDCSPYVGTGGGIHVSDGDMLTITGTTLSGNHAANAGSGVYVWGQGMPIFADTVVNDDCSGAWGAEVDWVSLSGNLESPGDTCGFDQEGDQVNVSVEDLKLGELADNGGPTLTHALLPGSVAIDAIPAEACLDSDGGPLTTDQRGEPRPGGPMCDVGAFEVQP
jgi:hypothetical protein